MIRRSGNFGFVDTGSGLYSFNMNARSGGWEPTTFRIRGGRVDQDYIEVAGVRVIPFGHDNDLPGYVERILDRFYAGEGILGKKIGLQWGDGPKLYREATDGVSGRMVRVWEVVPEAEQAFAPMVDQMHRCLVDLAHMEGFWVKVITTRGRRIGRGRIAYISHIPASRVRFVWPGRDDIAPKEAVVGDFPNPDRRYIHRYPLFDPSDPLRHAVSVAYIRNYSFGKEYYSIPRFTGAYEWIELAGTLPGVLAAYNENASAISMHIESPQQYWDDAEEKIREQCTLMKEPYSPKMLEEYKDAAMEEFAASLTGRSNAGKFLHTSRFFNGAANSFDGWKVTPIDKKIKDYIEAQVAICGKSEAAATSGFGLDPALANLILDTKLGSGSEKLYSLKVYNATETAIPDMVLCRPFQWWLDSAFPGRGLKIGLHRPVVEAEKNVNPEARVKANI